MNAIAMLENDHRRIAKLLREFEKAGDGAFRERQELAAKVFRELEIHMKAEEEILYLAMEDAAGSKSRDLVREAVAEHEVVHATMDELRRMEPDAETYSRTFEVLIEKLEHHFEKEESQMLPAGSKLGRKRLENLGARMAASRRRRPGESSTLLGDTLRQAKTVVAKAFGDTALRNRSKPKVAVAAGKKKGSNPGPRRVAR